jgi:hypothetical protein
MIYWRIVLVKEGLLCAAGVSSSPSSAMARLPTLASATDTQRGARTLGLMVALRPQRNLPCWIALPCGHAAQTIPPRLPP